MDKPLILPGNTVLDGSYQIGRVIGVGGFSITYEAEDLNLRTVVAIKEYYPADSAERNSDLSVRAKSQRQETVLEQGRTHFLRQARELARFSHPSVVGVTRVFEANATAYMVMRFESGLSFEAWLASLGRPPTQEELDLIAPPLLDALEMLHSANVLHRDITPNNILIRPDGTPVLLGFGAGRRDGVAEPSSVTAMVKAGYSPHEQHSSGNGLEGPWSDFYALGGTLYRAVTGRPPDDAMLRIGEDRMPPAVAAGQGDYRKSFLAGIDASLRVRQTERPPSVTELRRMLLPSAGVKATRSRAEPAMVSEHSAVREREPQPVDATAFCPKKFAAGETELVQIMVHLKGQRRAALRLAREADSRSRFAAPSRSLDELKIGDKVAVHLTVHGAKVDNPPDTQTWIGETLTFSFGVTSNGQTRRVAVNATISINGVCIGRIAFKRSVARTFTLADIARYLFPPRLSRFKRVFFSYSSADRPLVLQQADEYRKFGISFFQDILHLDAGERWERRLWKEINRCDLFVLFWSSHARDSDWVIKEVEHAWRRQARNGGQRPMLRPELLEHPPPLPKQDWLREFNFNDPKFHKN